MTSSSRSSCGRRHVLHDDREAARRARARGPRRAKADPGQLFGDDAGKGGERRVDEGRRQLLGTDLEEERERKTSGEHSD